MWTLNFSVLLKMECNWCLCHNKLSSKGSLIKKCQSYEHNGSLTTLATKSALLGPSRIKKWRKLKRWPTRKKPRWRTRFMAKTMMMALTNRQIKTSKWKFNLLWNWLIISQFRTMPKLRSTGSSYRRKKKLKKVLVLKVARMAIMTGLSTKI